MHPQSHEELEEEPDRRDQLAERRLGLEAQRSDLLLANIAFHANRAMMVPPATALVREIADLSKAAVALTSERATAAAIVKLATSALSKFAEIQDIEDD